MISQQLFYKRNQLKWLLQKICYMEDNNEFLKTDEGIDFIVTDRSDLSTHAQKVYQNRSLTNENVVFKSDYDVETITKTMKVTNTGLPLQVNYARKSSNINLRNIFVGAFSIGSAERIAYKVVNSDWNYYQLQNNMEYGYFGKKLKGETKISIADCDTKKGVEIDFNNDYDFLRHSC